MSTYREIIGKKIKKVSSDPSTGVDGEMWYNSTTGTLRGPAIVKAWSSGAPILTAREKGGGFGTQTAAVLAGGNAPPQTTATEEYNGSGWSAGGVLGTARARLGSAGIVTAGLAFGGGPPSGGVNLSESYNGSSWSEGDNLGTARYTSGTGTQTAALAIGGNVTPGATDATEEYGGTSWTAGGALNTARNYIAGFGLQTAAVAASGGPAGKNNVEEYNGTAWINGTVLSNAREIAMASGIQTDGIVYGGRNDPGSVSLNKTEQYDGTSWTAQPTMATARFGSGANQSSGTASAAIAAGGNINPPNTIVNVTEEYNATTSTFTAAAWSSGNALNTGRQDVGGTGTKNAGLAIGGRTGSSGPFTQSGASEEYDGTSWTAPGNNLNTARGEASGAGTQTAAICFGGAPDSNATETYNGSTWTTSPLTLNTGRSSGGSFGASSTSAVFCGGYGGARVANVEEFNGSSWANATAMPEARYNCAGAGIEAAGIIAGGSNAPSGTVTFSTSIEYDGSNWTTGGTNLIAVEGQGMNGTQAACISYGGPNALTLNCTTYDGTSWFTNPSMATNRTGIGASKGASITNTMGFGGSTPPNRQMTNTEEFTAETTALNIETFTTS